MAFLDTSHKRKSAVMTSIIAVLMLILMFLFGLTYLDPPEEFGIAVNFGTTDYGSGNQQPTEALKPAAQSEPETENTEQPVEEVVEEVKEEVQEEVAEASAAEEEAAEEVITQANEEAIAIKKKEEEKKRKENEVKAKKEREAEAKRKAEAERQAEIERKSVAEAKRVAEEKAAQEAKKKSLDALMGGYSDDNGKADGGEGDDNQAGDKGKPTGDPNASGYYGIGGDGGGGNFLGNRTALNKIDPDKVCDEGTVVVEITVDRNGKVIFAKPGAKGTTNSVACLYDEAKKAAMSTKFNPDSNAPEKQFGYIIYNFSYSE